MTVGCAVPGRDPQVADLATNRGSRGELPRGLAVRLKPNAHQMRDAADRESPTSAAIDRVDQCVASLGVDSSVLMITYPPAHR